MPTLIVSAQGAMLHCRDGRIVVEHEGAVAERQPCEQVDRVLLLGAVGMTVGFVNWALGARTSVTFLTREGGYKGRLDPGARRDVAARIAQYGRLTDLEWRLAIARRIVTAKIGGQRALLMRSARNHGRPDLSAASEALLDPLRRVARAKTLPEAMGCEGRAARIYFQALPGAIRSDLPFRGRSRRPPRDPVNALLSLGYGMLTAETTGALAGMGLDPQVGVFHSPRKRVPALAEDILEAFRAPAADALALSLANLRVLRPDHFETTAEQGCRLTKPGLELFFRHYRRRMTAPFNTRDGRSLTLRRAVQEQAAQMRRAMLGEEEFEPFVLPKGGART